METRTCKCCLSAKPLSEFHSKVASNGIRYWRHTCVECVKPAAKERKRRWYYADPERAKADSRGYYKANRERVQATHAAYIATHRADRRAYMREYMRSRRAHLEMVK